MRSSTGMVMATIGGGAVGLAVGVTLALLRVPVPPISVMDVSLTPSVSGLVVGLVAGFAFGLLRRLFGARRSQS